MSIKKIGLVLTSLIISLIIVVIVSYHLAYRTKIYPFVYLGPVNVSNLTLTQAREKLTTIVRQNYPQEIILNYGDQSYQWPTQNLKLQYQADQSSQRAWTLGRQGNLYQKLKTRWRLWHQPEKLSLDYQLDWIQLENQVASLAAQLNQPAQLASVSIDQGQLKVFKGKNGQSLNQGLILKTIDQQLSQLNLVQLTVSLNQIEVELGPAEVENLSQRGQKFIGQKLNWQTKTDQAELNDNDLVKLLAPGSGYNLEQITQLVNLISQRVETEPINALFNFSNNRVQVFQPSQPGVKLDKTITQTKLIQALEQIEAGQKPSSIDLPVSYQEPEIATGAINDLGIKELLGRGQSTFWGSIASRIHNIQITTEKIQGLLIKPGESFSFNQAVGDISKETGYQTAYVIRNGRTELGDGGGVCQVSTTLFRAILQAGLNITERRAHSYRVGYYEQGSALGLDATVYAPHPDLSFINDTDHHLLIQTQFQADQHQLIIEFYGTSDGRQASLSKTRVWDQSPPPEPVYVDDPSLPLGTTKQIDWAAWGAKAAFDWQVTRQSEVLQDKTFYSTYQPWQAVYLRGTKQ